MAHPKELLKKLGASALRGLSQNFLTSEFHAKKMVDAVLEGPLPDEYWEIGPGLGALTEILVKNAKKPVRLFEFDKKLAQNLRNTLPDVPLEEGDFLETDFEPYKGRTLAILGNLPFHISSQILLKLLPLKSQTLRSVFTFQKEYAEKLLAKPRTKEYGSLSILMQLNFEMKTVIILPAGVFFPAPNVDSSVLLFTPKPDFEGSDKVEAVVRTAFQHRRKKLSSNLKAYSTNTDWEAMLKKIGFDSNTRAEELSPLQFVELVKLLG